MDCLSEANAAPQTLLADRIRTMVNQGYSCQEIAAAIGMTQQQVWHFRSTHGIRSTPESDKLRGERVWRRRLVEPPISVERVLELIAQGKYIDEAANILGRSEDRVRRFCQRHGISWPHKPRQRVLTDAEKARIEHDYKVAGDSIKIIAERLRTAQRTVQRHLIDAGITIRATGKWDRRYRKRAPLSKDFMLPSSRQETEYLESHKLPCRRKLEAEPIKSDADRSAAIEAFIAKHGVQRCPTAFVAPSQAGADLPA